MDLNRYNNNMLRILVHEKNEKEQLTSQEIQFLDALAKAADMWHWPEEFTPRNQLLLNLTAWGSESKIKRVRASLVKKGFIYFTARKRKAGVYKFTNKITGKNVKTIKDKKKDTQMSYSSSDDSNIIQIVNQEMQEAVDDVQLGKAEHHEVTTTQDKLTVDPQEQDKADHQKWWPSFAAPIMPALQAADKTQLDRIQSYYQQLNLRHVRDFINRFWEVDWSSKRSPVAYVIAALKNEIEVQEEITAQETNFKRIGRKNEN